VTGPLEGLRVLEVATGIAGPYAGRLLALLGAEVVKVEPPGGDVTRRMGLDDRPVAEPGPLHVHLTTGKTVVDDAPPEGFDVVLDDRVRREREGTALDPARLVGAGVVVVSMTAWGYDHDEPGEPGDELLVQAASGMVQATMDEGRPHRFPGWQSQYLAGAYGVAGALTALAGRDGAGHHVDVSWVGSIVTGVEAGVAAHLHGGSERQAGFQVGAFPAGVFRCKDGHVIPGTVRPVDWSLQCGVYGREDLLEDERFRYRNRWANRDLLRAELQPWYDAHTKQEIFDAALEAGWALGMVMTAEDALTDRHLAARGFVGGDGIVRRPWLTTEHRDGTPAAPRRVDDLKVLELTWAWAGPFVGRWLGAYGADVVRIETGRHPDGWRTRLTWKQAGLEPPEGAEPDDVTYDAAALHNSLNRNKRSLSLDLGHPEGRALFLELLAGADLLVLNMSYRMLADRGIEAEVQAAVERGLVVLNMPSLGATGPYRDMPGYGILVEGMGGFAARYGGRDEGARATNTYYPDLVAGLHGTIAALAALDSGRGQLIDLSQQEVTWLQFGEVLVHRARTGGEPDRLGDAEPGRPGSGYVRCADDRWVAVVPPADAVGAMVDGHELAAWCAARPADEVVAGLRGRGPGWGAEVARRYGEARAGLEARGALEELHHPVTGRRPYLALPVRIDGSPWRSRRPAACFGQHTDEVLQDWLAAPVERLAGLRDAGAIGSAPPARR
jgi:crotonobetainyl-CoA:carnitine CoA-transferase CaiB-like acyl-CoA transferase